MRSSIKIGVLDNRLDADHCDFDKNVAMSKSESSGWARDLEPASFCGQEWNGSLLRYHHGTHVVGLIAAMLNGKGTVGLNPYAAIKFAQVNMDDFSSPKAQTELIESILVSMALVRVINVSWQYVIEGGEDGFMRLLDQGGPLMSKLVVASAGNSGTHYGPGENCRIRPACLDFENVISVVGLDANLEAPELWVTVNDAGSNSGSRFDIAAVAENVLSTAAGNYVGRLSGTSQAAPQVTAAASLIHSVFKRNHSAQRDYLPPHRVKNRLMYTADLYQHLLKDVFSGRLNVQRALAVADDQFIIADEEHGALEFSGQIILFGVKRGWDPDECTPDRWEECKSDIIYCERSDSERDSVDISAIRRMYYSDKTREYVIFHNETTWDRESRLLRITDCGLQSRSQQVVVATDDGERTFELSQIRDFVSAMF